MISAGEFAKLIERTRQQVNNYRAKGMPSTKKGKYYYYGFDAIQWLITTGRREIKQPLGKGFIEEMNVYERNALVSAKLKELKLKRLLAKDDL